MLKKIIASLIVAASVGMGFPAVAQTAAPITVKSISNLQASVGTQARFIFEASGGQGKFTWEPFVSNLPPGLQFDIVPQLECASITCNSRNQQVTISGKPTQVGEFAVSLSVFDEIKQSSTNTFTISIISVAVTPPAVSSPPASSSASDPVLTPTPSFSSDPDPISSLSAPLQLRLVSTPFAGVVGEAFNATFQAAGGTGAFTFNFTGTLPPGLNLVSSSGVCDDADVLLFSDQGCGGAVSADLIGTPTQAGNFTFTINAVDTAGAAAGNSFTLTISPKDPSSDQIILTTNDSLVAIANTTASFLITAQGGSMPYSWSVTAGSLPSGFVLLEPPLPLSANCPLPTCGNFQQNSILIQGTAQTTGQYSFVLSAADATQKRIGERAFIITVLGAQEAASLGFDQSTVNNPIASPSVVTIPEGTTFKAAADPTVYYMARNGKQAYTSFEMLQLWKVPISDIVIVEGVLPPDDPNGAFVRFPENVLVKSKSSPAVYSMQNGSLHAFASMAALRRGRAVIKITTVPQGDIEFHQPFGEPIK